MAASIAIGSLSIVLMFVLIIFFPSFKIKGKQFDTFFLGPLLGAIIILAFGFIDYEDLGKSLIQGGSINPLEILALFLAMSFLSVVLDEAGFFNYISAKVARKANGSQYMLFCLLYILTGLLTVFTSNDIVILTFTPFIIFFAKRSYISPIPYLVSEFVAANTFSMFLIIGNPTNIYLAESFGISFGEYMGKMWLPTLLASLAALFLMLLMFRNKLSKRFTQTDDIQKLKCPFLAVSSLLVLLATIILMAVSSFISLPMWEVSLGGAGLLILITLLYAIKDRSALPALNNSFKRLPYQVVPFILSMFVIVLSIKDSGAISEFSKWLSGINPYLGTGLISFLGADFLNNIPMSVFFTEVIKMMDRGNPLDIYLAIISSNIGAFLTPVGALAGVMWMSILKRYNVRFSFSDFLRYFSPISVVSLLFAFLGLFIISL